MATVVLVGTLDTKGREYAFLADRIREHGVDVVLVDAGVMGEPLASPDVTREEVAAAAGADVAALVAAADRGAAISGVSTIRASTVPAIADTAAASSNPPASSVLGCRKTGMGEA